MPDARLRCTDFDHPAVLLDHRVGERDHLGDVRLRPDRRRSGCTSTVHDSRAGRDDHLDVHRVAVDVQREVRPAEQPAPVDRRAVARGGASAGSIGRRDRRDIASRRTAGSAPDAAAGCGSPRDSCRRRSSSCTRDRGASTGRASSLRAGSRRISAKKSPRSSSSGGGRRVEVHEHLAAPHRDLNRDATRTRRGRASRRSRAPNAAGRRTSTPIRGTGTRDSVHAPAPSSTSGPGAVPADVVEAAQHAVVAAHDHQRPPGVHLRDVRARRRDLRLAREPEPLVREDASSARARNASASTVPVGGKRRRRFGHAGQPTGGLLVGRGTGRVSRRCLRCPPRRCAPCRAACPCRVGLASDAPRWWAWSQVGS